ncbi:MAG: hypothetical protein WC700_09055 [Gemmatimonadaceae bacterium]|jgi:hypothetical protein
MSSNTTLAQGLDQANPNRLCDILQKLGLGTLLTPKTAHIHGDTTVYLPLDPPALAVTSVRVVNPGAGTGVSGSYLVQDAGGTAVDWSGANAPGFCLLSADGTTLEFATALALVDYAEVCYIPRTTTDITETFNFTSV